MIPRSKNKTNNKRLTLSTKYFIDAWWSANDCAEYLRVCKAHLLKKMVKEQGLPARKVGHYWYFKPQEVHDFVDKHFYTTDERRLRGLPPIPNILKKEE